ncbi:MAG: cytochrome c biogenesis protein CcsA [Erysipelotrichaceae bacterium]|jgi:ABC-type transport system involved in cytochrome c biogenesis permease subunit
MDYLFFAGLIVYFISLVLQFIAGVWKKEKLKKDAWYLFMAGAVLATVYLVIRGIRAGRLPMSNQFEFAATFSWGIAMILIVMHYAIHADWITTPGIFMTWAILLYAAMQPREITDLMPALRSIWFGIHIGSAAFAYAAFMLAGAAGIRYLLIHKKNPGDERLEEIDYFAYRLIAIGLLLLTVTILIGAVWAEEAWSAFWTWDPKEVWALITWILYSIYLHLRLSRKKKGVFMAWYAIISIPAVLFTFIGVNTMMPGLHSYG